MMLYVQLPNMHMVKLKILQKIMKLHDSDRLSEGYFYEMVL